ncbi:MAG TPA: hypothetical protein VIG41_08305 [Micrococcaceae bacterium]
MAAYEDNSAEIRADAQSATGDDGVTVRLTEVDGFIDPSPPDGHDVRNPFLLALWLGGTGLAILSILVAVIAAYRDLGQGFISSTSVEGMPLLFAVQPFAVPGLVLGTGAIIAALILQAIRWDRQRDGRPFSRR